MPFVGRQNNPDDAETDEDKDYDRKPPALSWAALQRRRQHQHQHLEKERQAQQQQFAASQDYDGAVSYALSVVDLTHLLSTDEESECEDVGKAPRATQAQSAGLLSTSEQGRRPPLHEENEDEEKHYMPGASMAKRRSSLAATVDRTDLPSSSDEEYHGGHYYYHHHHHDNSNNHDDKNSHEEVVNRHDDNDNPPPLVSWKSTSSGDRIHTKAPPAASRPQSDSRPADDYWEHDGDDCHGDYAKDDRPPLHYPNPSDSQPSMRGSTALKPSSHYYRDDDDNSCTESDEADDDDDRDEDYLPSSRPSKAQRRLATKRKSREPSIPKIQSRTAPRRSAGNTPCGSFRPSSSSLSKKVKRQRTRVGLDRRAPSVHVGDWFNRPTVDEVAALDRQVEELEPKALCCVTCRCSDDRRNLFLVKAESMFVRSGEESIWHRRCCHGITGEVPDSWASPVDAAFEEFGMLDDPKPSMTVISRCQMQACIETARKAATRKKAISEGEKQQAHPSDLLLTDERSQHAFNDSYNALRRQCEDASVKSRRLVTVVEAFGGLGPGTTLLKKLSIRINEVIYIDHDPVATHAFKFNHDPQYNPLLPDDGINFHYYSKFEQVSGSNLDDFMDRHGPVDLILGGPPCVDFSGLNSRRQGLTGEQGSLSVEMADFIAAIQQHRVQRNGDRPVFFVVENVAKMKEDDRDVLSTRLGIEYMRMASYCFSPTFRDRIYWTNIPTSSQQLDFAAQYNSTPDRCLDDGFKLALSYDTRPIAFNKILTFLAYLGRQDGPKMEVFKKLDDNRFACRYLSAEERGRLMGFPNGYITTANKALFHELSSAHKIRYISDVLDRPDYCDPASNPYVAAFRGIEVQCDGVNEVEGEVLLDLKIPPPRTKPDHEPDNRVFYNQEQYGKRLVGNSWNLPTVEQLLLPLKVVFAQREYVNFNYQYAWLNRPA